MKKATMTKLVSLLLGGSLLFAVTACENNAKTSSTAPNSMDKSGQVPDTGTTEANQGDAQSQVRKDQLNADIKAREQRNDVGGDQEKRADGDLESEVRSKLEANIPQGQLTVDSKDGAVTVAGTVPTEEQLAKVEPLVKEIKGVNSVKVEATVAAQ